MINIIKRSLGKGIAFNRIQISSVSSQSSAHVFKIQSADNYSNCIYLLSPIVYN